MTKATPEQLRCAVIDMDAIAHGAFSEIASMATLALLAMKQPATYGNGCGMDDIARVLSAIQGKAEDVNNCINSIAGGVSCNYIDSEQLKRWDAMREGRKNAIEKNGGAQ